MKGITYNYRFVKPNQTKIKGYNKDMNTLCKELHNLYLKHYNIEQKLSRFIVYNLYKRGTSGSLLKQTCKITKYNKSIYKLQRSRDVKEPLEERIEDRIENLIEEEFLEDQMRCNPDWDEINDEFEDPNGWMYFIPKTHFVSEEMYIDELPKHLQEQVYNELNYKMNTHILFD